MVFKIMSSLLFFSLSIYAGEIEYVAKSYVENSLLMSPTKRLQQESKKNDIALTQLCNVGSNKIVIKIPEKSFKKEDCLAASKNVCSKCAYGIMVGSPFVGIGGMFCIAGGCVPVSFTGFKAIASFAGITFGAPTACLCGKCIYHTWCAEDASKDISQETKDKNNNH
jgi:hypothetical protein